jgi:hypothetical protein
LDCRHVCKTCVFHDALQAGKQKKVHPPYSPDLAPAGPRSGQYDALLSVFPPEEQNWFRSFLAHRQSTFKETIIICHIVHVAS